MTGNALSRKSNTTVFEPGSSTLNAPNSYLVCIICFHETHQKLTDLKDCLRALRT